MHVFSGVSLLSLSSGLMERMSVFHIYQLIIHEAVRLLRTSPSSLVDTNKLYK